MLKHGAILTLRAFLGAIVLTAVPVAATGPAPPLSEAAGPARGSRTAAWSGLDAGPHAVGFDAFFTTDPTRPYWPTSIGDGGARVGPDRGRPIRVFLWYPAEPERGAEAMTFGAYLRFSDVPAWAKSWNDDLNLRSRRLLTITYGTGELIFERLTRRAVMAHESVPMAAGFHPLIVYSTGSNSHQLENVPLFEILASHGFVVANVPQFDHEWPAMTVGSINAPEGRDAQVRDLEFAVSEVRSRFTSVGNSLGAMGFSGGGLYSFLLGMRHSEYLDAFMSLDGSLAYGHVESLEDRYDWDPRKVTFPILNLHKASDNLDLARFDSFRGSRRYHVNLGDAYHLSFTQLPLVNALDPESQTYYDDDELAEAGSRYMALCRVVVLFARGHLMGDAASLSQLETLVASSPLPPPIASARVDPGSSVLTEDEIVRTTLAGNADAIVEKIRQMEADEGADFDVDRLLQRVRIDLGWFQRHDEAAAVLEALLRWRPSSARVLAQLVDTELDRGRKAEAGAALERLRAALATDPHLGDETRARLRERADEMHEAIARSGTND